MLISKFSSSSSFFFQYNDIYNFPQKVFDKAVEAVEVEGESEAESEGEEEKEQEIEKEVELELEADEKEREREANTPHFIEAETDDEDEDDNFDIQEVSMVICPSFRYKYMYYPRLNMNY